MGKTLKTVARSGSGRAIIRQLDDIEADGGDGALDFGRGKTLRVSSLGKPYFPGDGITKGDVMRYYAGVWPTLLPVIKDRPLVLKRIPRRHRRSVFLSAERRSAYPARRAHR